MKTLALLCNLHAEGPRTLERLRRDGCEGLGALLEYETRDLARLLDWDDARAERFLREAAELSERVEEGLLANTEEDVEAAEVADELDADDELEDDEELGEDDEDGRGAGIREVLEVWRGLDESAPPADVQAAAEEAHGVLRPRPAPPARTPLRALDLEGLDAATLARLARADVTGAEELAERSALELSAALGLGLTRVLRLQFLVRRALRRDAPRTPA